MDEFRQSVVIPIVDDMYAIFLTSTYLLGLLRVNAGRQVRVHISFNISSPPIVLNFIK
jgi:hypothetical protein